MLGFSKPPLWAAAASRGPAALDALAKAGCQFLGAEGVGLAQFCAQQRLAPSFAWAVSHGAGLRRDKRKSWALCALLIDKLLDPQSIRAHRGMPKQDSDWTGARLARDAMRKAAGAPPDPLLLQLCRQGRFGSLVALLETCPIDAARAQKIADARPLGHYATIYRSLGLDGGERSRHLASMAGAMLAPFAPTIDLALDAQSLDPRSCAFSISAGAHPKKASSPPLASLCESAARLFSPSNHGWLLLQSLASRGSTASHSPEAACALMLIELGCLSSERLPGRPSAARLCQQSIATHRRVASSERSLRKMAKLGGMLSWVAKQVDPATTLVLDRARSPMEPLGLLLQTQADLEALAQAVPACEASRRPRL
jgi:hypothetical protein